MVGRCAYLIPFSLSFRFYLLDPGMKLTGGQASRHIEIMALMGVSQSLKAPAWLVEGEQIVFISGDILLQSVLPVGSSSLQI